MIPEIELRFWSNVEMTLTGCWNWKAGMGGDYGCFRVGNKTYGSHTLAYRLFYKKEPTQKVLHKCNNSLCVNPFHLYDGTQMQNMHDKAMCGRAARKMTAEKVIELRRMRKQGYTRRQLQKHFGITYAVVRDIELRISWNHIPDEAINEAKSSLVP